MLSAFLEVSRRIFSAQIMVPYNNLMILTKPLQVKEKGKFMLSILNRESKFNVYSLCFFIVIVN